MYNMDVTSAGADPAGSRGGGPIREKYLAAK